MDTATSNCDSFVHLRSPVIEIETMGGTAFLEYVLSLFHSCSVLQVVTKTRLRTFTRFEYSTIQRSVWYVLNIGIHRRDALRVRISPQDAWWNLSWVYENPVPITPTDST